MKVGIIDRFAFGPNGTFGRLSVHDEDTELMWCYSLEPPSFPWVPENARDISCIPVGEYRLERGIFHRNTATPDDDYPCLVIPDGEVPDRGPGVKIHAGNTLAATLGCPLTGSSFEFMNGLPAVRASRKALRRVLEAWGTSSGKLTVRELRP